MGSIYLVAAFMFIGDPYIGISVHSEYTDSPEFSSQNPIGVFGAELNMSDNIVLFTEHTSSISKKETGYGMNVVGLKYKF